MTSAHDRYLAAYSSMPVDIVCRSCECSFAGVETTEYGAAWTEPEECPQCGSTELDCSAMSEYDIAERRAEANGQGDRI